MTVLTELALPPGVEADRLPSAVLADLRSGEHRGVVVDPPSGAGKSTNEQVDELLNARPTTERAHLDVPVKFPDGWEAN